VTHGDVPHADGCDYLTIAQKGEPIELDNLYLLPKAIRRVARLEKKPHDSNMDELLEKMRERVIAQFDGIHADTPIPNLSLGVIRQPLIPETAFSAPMVCVVLQGVKQVLVGSHLIRYGAGDVFASAVELPASGCVLEAHIDKPYVALGLTLDLAMLANLITELPPASRSAQTMGFGVATASQQLLRAFERLLALLDRPDDVVALSKGREREVLYELMRSEHAPMLRQSLGADSQLARIRQVIARIREQFDKDLSVSTLANLAGMSIPSFHRHFKAATGMSPLQYQKTIQLHAARKLIVASGDAARTAYAVGYESPSQFSREYSRLFGISPARDAERIRQGTH